MDTKNRVYYFNIEGYKAKEASFFGKKINVN